MLREGSVNVLEAAVVSATPTNAVSAAVSAVAACAIAMVHGLVGAGALFGHIPGTR
jgi:hypothetical protein